MPAHARSRSIRPFAALLTVVAAAGCADARAGGPEIVREMDGDTAVVRTISGSVWGAEATLEPELSIGVLDGDEHYMFGRVSAIAVGPDGRIFVLDAHVPAVRVYDASGAYIATLGRRGGGPGELSSPEGLAVLSDGRVLIRDPANTRIQVFTRDLQPGGEWSVIAGGFSTSNPLWLTRGDTIHTMVLYDREASVTEWRFGLQRIAPNGTIVDTIVVPRTDVEPPSLVARQEGGTSQTMVPFAPREYWALHPEGHFVHGFADGYRFTVLDAAAPTRIERVADPVPVAGGERGEEERRVTVNMRRTQPDWRWNGPPIPDAKPAYKGFQTGRDGRIWVMVSMPGVERDDPDHDPTDPESVPNRWTEPTAFDVFERDGTYAGRVHAPEGFTVFPAPVIDGDRVWAVVTDELGVARVVRFRVVVGSAAEN